MQRVQSVGWLIPKEVAVRLRIHVNAVYERIKSGELPAINVGTAAHKVYRVDETALETYIQSLVVKPTASKRPPSAKRETEP